MDDLIARCDALKIELAELEAVKAEAARLADLVEAGRTMLKNRIGG